MTELLSANLELSLYRALRMASDRGHPHAGVAHLLLALTEDADATGLLQRLAVDVLVLRQDLSVVLDAPEHRATGDGEEALPTASFQRVLQRAAINVQCAGGSVMTGAHTLIALAAERDNAAAALLVRRGFHRGQAVALVYPREATAAPH